MSENDVIFYISERDKYGWMSNMWSFSNPIYVKGFKGYSVEAMYQAAKVPLDMPELKNEITQMKPWDSKKKGKVIPLRQDWDEVKDKIMKHLVYQKFHNNPNLGQSLVNTDPALIVEDAPWDSYWGSGQKGAIGSGLNKMGKILMDVRSLILLEK